MGSYLRGLTILLAAVLLSFGAAHAGSTFSNLPAASQPLGGGTGKTYVPLDQGDGCLTQNSPCATVQSDSLRIGQPIQTNCAAINSPWQYQLCIDTSLSPTVLKEFIGITWWPLVLLDGTTGPVSEIGGGGGGGGINLRNTTLTANYTIGTNDNGVIFNNLGAAGTVAITLPAVASHNGWLDCFSVGTAQTVTVVPQSADQIVLGVTIGDNGAVMTSNTVNSSVCLIANNTNSWVAVSSPDGVWTLNGTATVSMPTVLSYLPLNPSLNLADVGNAATARANLGLGTIATQDASAVAITGGVITGLTGPMTITAVNPIPTSTSYTGPRDFFRLSINNFPTTAEFSGDPTGNIGATQGIVGAVVQPSNVSPTVSAWFGVAGYAACNTGVGIAGGCTGVSGNGVAFGSGSISVNSFIAGINGVVTNSPIVTNLQTRSGFDYINMSGAEIDIALMKLSDGSTPHSNVVGISIVGVSETQPPTGPTDCSGGPCLAAGIFLQPMGLSPVVGWFDAIRITDGAATRNGISIGATCEASGKCGAQPITLDAYTGASPADLIHGALEFSGDGFLVLDAPTGGNVALQVNNVNVLNVLGNGIFAAQHLYGGMAAGSTLGLVSTSSGSPSGDFVSILGSTTNIGSTDGMTAFASFSSTAFTLAVPITFPTSTTGAVTPGLTNAPTGCSNVVWVGPFKTSSPAQSNVYLAACHT